MATSLYKSVMDKNRKEANDDIASQLVKAQGAENKRKKRSSFFGNIAGKGLGMMGSHLAGMALMGVTGGAINPMTLKLIQAGVMGVGKTMGQAGAEQATAGRWGKKFKTPGQIEVKAKGEYGYGKDDVKEINKDLQEQRKSTVDLETLGGNVTGEIMALGAGELKDYGLDKLTDTKIGASINDKLASTFGMGDVDKFKEGIQERYKALNPQGYEEDFWDLGEEVKMVTAPQHQNQTQLLSDLAGTQEPYEFGSEFANGGQVPKMDQNMLMQLILASQMGQQQENTSYSNTALEDSNMTIVDKLSAKGKTLGGSNTQSLSQMMGR